LSEVPPLTPTAPMMLLSPIEAPPPPVSKELKRRWSYFIRKVYETDPLVCPKCAGEMRIISFIDQLAVIKKNLQHLDLWEESHAPPDRGPPEKEITFDPSYSQLIPEFCTIFIISRARNFLNGYKRQLYQ